MLPIKMDETVVFVLLPLTKLRPDNELASTRVSPGVVTTDVTVAVTESLARIIRVNPPAWISPVNVEPPSRAKTSESRLE